MESTKKRLTALLLAFAMAACFFWEIPVHAADTSSQNGKEQAPAVSESSEQPESDASSSGENSSDPETSSEGENSSLEPETSPKKQVSEAEDKDSSASEPSWILKEQQLKATVYLDKKQIEKADGDTNITVEGRLPEGAVVKAYPVKVQNFDKGKILAAFDITLYGPDGKIFEPEDPVEVSISTPEFKDADSVNVYHLKDAGEQADIKNGAGAESSRQEDEKKKESLLSDVKVDGDTKDLKASKTAESVHPENRTVKFQAESFSIYLVTYNQQLVDGDTYYIAKDETITLQDNHDSGTWTTSDPDSVINLTSDSETANSATVKGLKPGQATITYTYSNNRESRNDSCTIIVEGEEGLHQVTTLNSNLKGIQLEMFDYDYGSIGSFSLLNSSPTGYLCSNPQEAYSNGTTKEGLLKRVVESNGFPDTIDAEGNQYTEKSLNQWFSSGGSEVKNYQKANHLFIQKTYDDTGYFHFSGAENFAALNGDEDSAGIKKFTVYQEIGTPSDGDPYYYQRGNFLPYNTINTMTKSKNTNQYDLNGQPLAEGDSKKGLPLYLMDQPVDYHFGMYMNTDFIQPKDGQIADPKTGDPEDMVFKFTGDDDLWIYVDGVLTLDIGGIHDAQSGYINFKTGEIGWTDTVTGGEKQDETTTIKEMLDDSDIPSVADPVTGNITYTAKKITENSAEDAEIVLKKLSDGSYTFADYSRHTLQMFYMERGAGASNLSIDFNLPVVPKNSITVTKQVEGLDSDTANQKEYKMRLYVQNDKGTYEPYNGEYTINGETHQTDPSDNTFSLKNEQTGVFSDISQDKNYYVEELNPDSDGISYQVGFSAGDKDQTDSGNPNQSKPVSASDEPAMTVTNTAQTGSLKVTKKLEGLTDTQTFDADFKLYQEQGTEDTLIRTVSYQSDFKNTDSSGNRYYVFSNLPYGTYYVAETVLEPKPYSGTQKTAYAVISGGNPGQETGTGKDAAVTLGPSLKEGEILVTNTYEKKYVLPKAGGSGTMPFQMTGTAVLSGTGIGFYLYKKKRRNAGKEPI